jgi:hypothetical protein
VPTSISICSAREAEGNEAEAMAGAYVGYKSTIFYASSGSTR